MDVHPPNPALDVFLILLSELHASGKIDDAGMERIIIKLELSEYHDIADRVATLPLMNELGNPQG